MILTISYAGMGQRDAVTEVVPHRPVPPMTVALPAPKC